MSFYIHSGPALDALFFEVNELKDIDPMAIFMCGSPTSN